MKRAFSLFEVMVAIVILLMLSGAVYTFVWNLMDDRQRAGEHAARSAGATRFISLLEADLLTCVARTDSGKAGVSGEAMRLAVASRHAQLVASGLGDVREAVYAFDEGSGELRAGRGGAELEPIATGIAKLRFRYLLNKEWETSFDSQAAGSLPRGVEVAIWFGKPREESKATDAASPLEGAASAIEDAPGEADELLPPPDRLAVIAIPDGGDEAASSEGGEVP